MYSFRQVGPRIIERGVTVSLDGALYDPTGAVLATAAAATITITDGDEELLAATAATTLLPLAYTLAAATTTDRPLSSRLRETWNITVGTVPIIATRSACLVRSAFLPSLTDIDLIHRHSDLLDLLPPDTTDLTYYRDAAAEKIQRDLLKRGDRADLIFDSWALYDWHLNLALHYVFLDAKSSIGDGRYAELAAHYLAQADHERDEVKFRVDGNKTGNITSDTQESAYIPTILTGAPVRGWWS